VKRREKTFKLSERDLAEILSKVLLAGMDLGGSVSKNKGHIPQGVCKVSIRPNGSDGLIIDIEFFYEGDEIPPDLAGAQ
jgi:hypothetical protein